MPRTLIPLLFLSTVVVVSQEPSRDTQLRQTLAAEARAFWASPSISGFLAYGDTLTALLATDELRGREDAAGKPLRDPQPEYDAMKLRLTDAVIPRLRPVTPPGPGYLPEPLTKAMARVSLPAARQSFFRTDDLAYVIPLLPFTLDDQGAGMVDALSAFHRVSLRAQVLEGARTGQNSVIGAWDVGVLGVTFEEAVSVSAVTADGAITGATVSAVQVHADSSCSASGLSVTPTGINAQWRAAIVGWIGKPSFSTKGVAASRVLTGPGQYDKLVIDDIDLDGDRIADFFVVSGTEPPEISDETFWRAVYANVGGRWILAAFSQQADCT